MGEETGGMRCTAEQQRAQKLSHMSIFFRSHFPGQTHIKSHLLTHYSCFNSTAMTHDFLDTSKKCSKPSALANNSYQEVSASQLKIFQARIFTLDCFKYRRKPNSSGRKMSKACPLPFRPLAVLPTR